MKRSSFILMASLFSFVVLFLFSTIGVSASSAKGALQTSQPKADSFELFWPIVAGKVRGDSMYSLKLFKEKLRESLIFSSFKKADYKITISEKRLVELEYLFKKGDFLNGSKSEEDLKNVWKQVVDLINESSTKGMDVISLKTKFISSLEKQSLILKALSLELKGDQKTQVEKLLEIIKNTSSSL